MPETLISFLTSLMLIILAEIGDKTQLLIIGLSTKGNPIKILLGVALGSLLSHGLAIYLCSSFLPINKFKIYIQVFAYITFIIWGVVLSFKKEKDSNEDMKKNNFGIILSVTLAIFIGELGDKTQLSSVALSFIYPNHIIPVILGSILGMVFANAIAIVLGVYLHKNIPKHILNVISNVVFILFGIIGLLTLKIF